MARLRREVRSSFYKESSKHKKVKELVVYGKQGDEVIILFDYDDILIVQHAVTGEKFSVLKEEVER